LVPTEGGWISIDEHRGPGLRGRLVRETGEEATVTVDGAGDASSAGTRYGNPPSLADQIRDLNPPPLGDGMYYAQDDVFASDEEMEAFVASVREARQAGIA
jgi:hypothetical protein